MRLTFAHMNTLRFAFAIFTVVAWGCSTGKKEGKSDNSDTSFAALDARIKKNPKDAEAFFIRGSKYLGEGKLDQAAGDLEQALTLDSTKPRYFLAAADLHLMTNNSGKCKAALDKCLSLDPKQPDALLKEAELYLFVKQNKTSGEYANKVIDLYPNNAKAHFLLGMNQKEMGDTAKAIYCFQKTVEIDPQYYHAFIQLGNLYSARNNPLALEYYKTAARINTKSSEPFYNIGVYHQKSGKVREALEAYGQALKLNTRDERSWYNLGILHQMRTGDLDNAWKAFDKAIALNPDRAESWLHRAQVNENMGKPDAARRDYTEALRVRGDLKEAFDALKRLDKP